MIYKLKYTDKDEAIKDLKTKGILNKSNSFKMPTHNVVFVGLIPETYGTYDEEGNELTPPTFKAGFHVDVMDERLDLDFGSYRKFPEIEYHAF